MSGGLEGARALHERGQLEAAVEAYDRLLAERPDWPEARHLLAIAQLQLGRPERAAQELDRVVVAADGTQVRYHRGLARLNAGDADGARSDLEVALAGSPHLAEAWAALGSVELSQANAAAAEEALRRAVRENPDLAEAWNNLGAALRMQGRSDEAHDAVLQAIRKRPGLPHGWENLREILQTRHDAPEVAERLAEEFARHEPTAASHLVVGLALERAHHADEALGHYRAAQALDPAGRAGVLAGRLLSEQARDEEALPLLAHAAEVRPGDLEARWLLAVALTRLSFVAAAEDVLGRILQEQPDDLRALTTLGWLLLNNARVEEGRALLEHALRVAPGNLSARLGLAAALDRSGDRAGAHAAVGELLQEGHRVASVAIQFASTARSQPDLEQARELLESVLASPSAGRQAASAGFALARVLDRLGCYDEAFERADAANRTRSGRYDPAANRDMVDRLVETFGPGCRVPSVDVDATGLVLVIGIPRSGTTLVEQMLASHEDVYGAGEVETLNSTLIQLPGIASGGAEYPEALVGASAEAVAGLARIYVEDMRARAAGASVVVDKLPQNHWHLGFAARALPGLRVVHVVRDPRDVALSLYLRDFQGLQRFAYALGDIAGYVADFHRLMDAWRTLEGLSLYEVRYERLVADPEPELEKLASFLGLGWDPAMLRFHELSRPVASASYHQVRQPLYSSAVGRWRRYATHLAPLIDAWRGSRVEAWFTEPP